MFNTKCIQVVILNKGKSYNSYKSTYFICKKNLELNMHKLIALKNLNNKNFFKSELKKRNARSIKLQFTPHARQKSV